MGNRSKNLSTFFGKQIRKLRDEQGLTQIQIGEIVNKSDSAVRMWELEKSEPDIQTLLILADYFKVSVDYLLGHNVISTNNTFSASFNLSEKEKYLLELFNSLSENMQNLLIQTAENFVSASEKANNKVKRA